MYASAAADRPDGVGQCLCGDRGRGVRAQEERRSPDCRRPYGCVSVCWTGFVFKANLVEKYVLLAALLRRYVTLKRTLEISLHSPWSRCPRITHGLLEP
jgi:hypothetical protein